MRLTKVARVLRSRDVTAQHGFHDLGRLAFAFGQDVGVDLPGRAGVGVAEALLHDVLGHAGVSAGRRRRVPCVVQRDDGYCRRLAGARTTGR